VLRRIMRRAMRHAHMMGAREPVMDRLVPALTRQMGAAYPELITAEPLIRETLRLEESRFAELLDRGIKLLFNEWSRIGEHDALPGEVAFKLYDTYGFPLDLTQDVLREKGGSVDLAGFDTAMAEQRRRARAAWSGSGEAGPEAVWFELREKLGATEFLGYTSEVAEAEITALVVGGMRVERVDAGEQVQVLLNQTPFYAESGGQVGDSGVITGPDNLVITITDTQKKPGNLFAHIGRVVSGTARAGAPVRAEIDHTRRAAIAAHHSATHLLHAALRERLGPHVTQKGSLNAPDRLRFDVSQPRPITAAELAQVEADVNAQIRANTAVSTRLMTPQAAVEEGAMALFGEKYGDEVRVVSMGTVLDGGGGAAANHAYSVELCGGTHIPRTGNIGLFRIVAESAVAAGIRRIEAVTGQSALTQIAESESRLAEIAQALKTSPAEAPARVAALVEDRRRLERQLADLQTKLALAAADGAIEQIGGVALIARNLGEVPPRELKTIADALRKQLGSGIVALVSTAEGKASLIVAVSHDLAGTYDAVGLVRAGSAVVGGKGGGGKPDLAQAGGPDGARADEALDAIRAALAG
jgi:alanyl-tRNA synthetase